ncbi:putative quinol monooxygenase [uncultured Amnibacterium sp.]|uniref:putative quinol monooxygenase n=1 Tax=uncultured Amnibacterium sp. TaxID=1631851 RepID=UPI0035CB22D5
MQHLAKFVYLKVRPEKKTDFMQLLEVNRLHTQNEPGTLEWTLMSVEGEPDSVAMFETYDGQQGSDEHDKSPALAAVLAALGDSVESEPVIMNLVVDRYKLDDPPER